MITGVDGSRVEVKKAVFFGSKIVTDSCVSSPFLLHQCFEECFRDPCPNARGLVIYPP